MSGSFEIAQAAPSLLRALLARSGKWATGVAFFGGVISDILNPLAPFAAYIALAAAVAAVIIGIAIVLRLLVVDRALPALVFASTAAAIAGGIFAVQKQAEAQDGIIAKLVPAITGLQQSVGIVAAKVEKIEQTVTETQKSVEEVKQTTARVETETRKIAEGQAKQGKKAERLQRTTEQVARQNDEIRKTTDQVAEQNAAIAASQARQEQATDEIADKTDQLSKQTEAVVTNQVEQQQQADRLQATTEKIADSIETIASGFAALAAQGGIIADPKRPDEFYHNARLHELSGDMLNARRDYLAFADFDIDAIDPYIRFATLLRVQDGKAGAREVFGALAAKAKAPALKLVHILQFDDQQRIARLDAFIAANPDYGPAYYLLGQEFSEDRLGAQTLADRRSEAEALNTFLGHEKDGGLLKNFIDHALLGEWLDHSRQRLAALGEVLDPSRFVPKLISMRSNQDWMFTVSLPEPATGISWRLGKEGPFTETGFLAVSDQTTGKPIPNPSFVLPASTPADTIGIKYLDLRGRETGPFEIKFDPRTMLQDGDKQVLDQSWTSWIVFDASGNHGLVYFSHMLTYRCALKEVRYAFNGKAPQTRHARLRRKRPLCDPLRLPALSQGERRYQVDGGAGHLCRRHAVAGTRVQALTRRLVPTDQSLASTMMRSAGS
jgi:hypothetical protein